MSTPSLLFDLGRKNVIIHEFLAIWQNGAIDWETMLFETHKHLCSRCFDLRDRFNLKVDHIEDFCQEPTIPIQHSGLYVDHRTIKIAKQQNFIEAIQRVAFLQRNIEEMAAARLGFESQQTSIAINDHDAIAIAQEQKFRADPRSPYVKFIG